MCRFRVNGRPVCHIFHCFQNVPASCERSLRLMFTQKLLLIPISKYDGDFRSSCVIDKFVNYLSASYSRHFSYCIYNLYCIWNFYAFCRDFSKLLRHSISGRQNLVMQLFGSLTKSKLPILLFLYSYFPFYFLVGGVTANAQDLQDLDLAVQNAVPTKPAQNAGKNSFDLKILSCDLYDLIVWPFHPKL